MNERVESRIVRRRKQDNDPDTVLKVQLAHEIQHFFQYRYKGRWVTDKELKKRDRLYEQVFNKLVKDGLIERKKKDAIYQYRWAAMYPHP